MTQDELLYDYDEYAIYPTFVMNALNDNQKRQLSYNMSQILLKCRFGGETCNHTDFVWFFDPLNSDCYKFNGKYDSEGKTVEARKASMSGYPSGLNLELYIPIDDEFYSFDLRYGAQLFIHNKSVTPSYAEALRLNSGHEAYIGISKTWYKRFPDPYSVCIEDSYGSFFTDFYSKNDLVYTQNECFFYCYQRKVVDTCECYDPGFPLITFNKTACFSLEKIESNNEVYYSFFVDEASSNCSKDCPLECEKIKFSYYMDSVQYPSYNLAKSFLARNEILQEKFGRNLSDFNAETYEKMKKTLVSFIVYYDDLSYTYVKELVKTTIEDLVSFNLIAQKF
jgi:hypothetical protein